MSNRPRPWLLAALVLATLALAPAEAQAHAAFVSADPAPNTTLARPPAAVTIRFSEPLVAEGSDIQVLDASGAGVDEGDSSVSGSDSTVLSVSVRPGLPDGVYTVGWRNVSDVDGHPLTGSFFFFVGEGDLEPRAVTEDDAPFFASPAEPAIRWLVLGGGMLLAGAPLAYALALRPAVRAREDARRIRGRVEGVAIAGGVVMVLASVAHLAVQAQSSGIDVASVLTDTTWGCAWLLRVGLAVAALAVYVSMRRARPMWAEPIAMLLAAGAIAAISLSSHAAATQGVEVPATIVDAVHVLAAAVWGGGLVAFLVLVARTAGRAESGALLRAAVPRFSVLGVVATVTLAVTGLYSAWLQVATARALETPYGLGVIAKVVILLALVALAAVNLLWVRHRLARPAEEARGATWLRRVMRAEVVGIVAALVVAGTIASLEPARQVWSREEAAAGQRSAGQDADLEIELAVSPGVVGTNRLTATLERGGDAYGGATGVMATLAYLDRELGTSEVPLEREADGRWGADVVLSLAGEYQVSVLVQRGDAFDARHAFRFNTGGGAASSASVSTTRAWWLGAGVLLAVGGTMAGVALFARRRRVLRGGGLGWAGAGVCAVGVMLLGQLPSDAGRLVNPVVPVPASIEAGRALYRANCVSCHGEGARGDGPQAPLLQFRPADLTGHVPLHTDAEIFEAIREGVPRRGMPPLGDALTDEEMWHIVNYLRAFVREQGAPVTPTPSD